VTLHDLTPTGSLRAAINLAELARAGQDPDLALDH